MNADQYAIEVSQLGKMYKIFPSRGAHICEVLGINRLMFWRQRRYREFWALRGVDFSIRRGERVGIIGHNGAGKSTLLKTLIGSHAPSEGHMRIRGRIQALMQLGTGFHPDFTGRENIRASLAYNNLTSAEIAAAEDEIVDFTELGEFIDQPVKNYSAGMYARLAFATATSIRPEILVIDEVLGAGDAYFAGKCVERMKSLSTESGATVLFVSHDLASVQNMCERCLWIDRGMLRMDGATLDVIKAYSAKVREREELRIKIRNEKKFQADGSVDVDTTVQQAFRIRAADDGPAECHVGKITVFYQGRRLGEVVPGTPMDCDTTQPVFVYPGEDGRAWGRPLDLTGGKTARFGALVERSWRSSDVTAVVEFAGNEGRLPVVEVLDRASGEYVPMGQEPRVESVADGAGKASDVYGSGECAIKAVRFETAGQESFLIEKNGVVDICFDYVAYKDVKNPLFVFAAYLPSGQAAMQIGASTAEVGVPVLRRGTGTFRFHVGKLVLGTGAYIASAAIFKKYPKLGIEPSAYHMLDRKIEFSVYSAEPQMISTGVCVQDFTSSVSESDANG